MNFLLELEKILKERKEQLPECSYTASLFKEGTDKILQKVGEEAFEYIIEAKNKDKARTVSEGADLLFHFLLSLTAQDINLNSIIIELKKRHKVD